MKRVYPILNTGDREGNVAYKASCKEPQLRAMIEEVEQKTDHAVLRLTQEEPHAMFL